MDEAFLQINALHIGFENVHMTKNAAERIHDVARIKITRCDFMQHRCKKNEILVTDQCHFHVRSTREPGPYGLDLEPYLELGASPRASLALVAASRGHALLSGRDYVTPHDVKSLARDVLRHRLVVSYEADAEGLTADDLIGRILDTIPVP